MKRASLFLIFLLWATMTGRVWAINENECNLNSSQHLDECIILWEQLLAQSGEKARSLKEDLGRLDTSIALAKAQIFQTGKQIIQLEKEIKELDDKIGRLDTSLNRLSQVLISRIVATYKQGEIEPLAVLFTADDFGNFLRRYHYLRSVQGYDRRLMLETETARTSFDDQKKLKEDKQDELKKSQKKLESQKTVLAQQKAAKDSLLSATKNDERRYQQLLSAAKTQLDSFRRFTLGQGGTGILSDQTKCDAWGCYYNQRDAQWGNLFLGGSSYLMKDSGCFITSVAMLASHFGKNIKPHDIAQLSIAITSNGYLKWSFNVNGINVSMFSASKSSLDSELAKGPVIAGLFSGPDHFIVILRKEGDKYIMHDPFLENGGNRPLGDKYNVSNITSLRLVQFN